MDMLQSLLDIEVAYSLLQGSVAEDQDPIDVHYESLKADIQVLDKTTEEFKLIQEYVKNTHAKTHSSYTLDIMDVIILFLTYLFYFILAVDTLPYSVYSICITAVILSNHCNLGSFGLPSKKAASLPLRLLRSRYEIRYAKAKQPVIARNRNLNVLLLSRCFPSVMLAWRFQMGNNLTSLRADLTVWCCEGDERTYFHAAKEPAY